MHERNISYLFVHKFYIYKLGYSRFFPSINFISLSLQHLKRSFPYQKVGSLTPTYSHRFYNSGILRFYNPVLVISCRKRPPPGTRSLRSRHGVSSPFSRTAAVVSNILFSFHRSATSWKAATISTKRSKWPTPNSSTTSTRFPQ